MSNSFCDPMDYSPPGSSVQGISQVRILEWVVISFSRDHPSPGIEPASPAWAGGFFTTEPPEKPYIKALGHEQRYIMHRGTTRISAWLMQRVQRKMRSAEASINNSEKYKVLSIFLIVSLRLTLLEWRSQKWALHSPHCTLPHVFCVDT